MKSSITVYHQRRRGLDISKKLKSKFGLNSEFLLKYQSYFFFFSNLRKLKYLLFSKKHACTTEQQSLGTTDDDGHKPIEIRYLSDSGDLEYEFQML